MFAQSIEQAKNDEIAENAEKCNCSFFGDIQTQKILKLFCNATMLAQVYTLLSSTNFNRNLQIKGSKNIVLNSSEEVSIENHFSRVRSIVCLPF